MGFSNDFSNQSNGDDRLRTVGTSVPDHWTNTGACVQLRMHKGSMTRKGVAGSSPARLIARPPIERREFGRTASWTTEHRRPGFCRFALDRPTVQSAPADARNASSVDRDSETLRLTGWARTLRHCGCAKSLTPRFPCNESAALIYPDDERERADLAMRRDVISASWRST